jgi:hypothetical protein
MTVRRFSNGQTQTNNERVEVSSSTLQHVSEFERFG